jgi:hypothetical protein
VDPAVVPPVILRGQPQDQAPDLGPGARRGVRDACGGRSTSWPPVPDAITAWWEGSRRTPLTGGGEASATARRATSGPGVPDEAGRPDGVGPRPGAVGPAVPRPCVSPCSRSTIRPTSRYRSDHGRPVCLPPGDRHWQTSSSPGESGF